MFVLRVSHAAMRMRRSIRRSLSSSRISLPSRKLEGKTGRKFANYSQVCTKRRTITAPFGRSYPPSSQCTSEPGVAQPRLAAGHPRITPSPALRFYYSLSHSMSHDLWGGSGVLEGLHKVRDTKRDWLWPPVYLPMATGSEISCLGPGGTSVSLFPPQLALLVAVFKV